MEESTASPNSRERPSQFAGRMITLVGIILLVLLAGFGAYRIWSARQSSAGPAPAERLSADELEARYGLRVRLIGVTAGGGMIDFRLKILEPEKARQFLQDPANLPISMVTENGTELLAASGMEDDVTWEEGGILFIMLPNSGGAIQPGDQVIVAFGDMQLEPLPAQ